MWFEGSHMTWREVALKDLEEVSAAILEKTDHRVWLFQGEMGSGKTTLIKAFCEHLGVSDPMSSPSFSIVNEYQDGGGRNVYHFDYYRIRNEAEAYDIGSEEYFYSGNLCFIEWPEKIPSLIPAEHAEISISVDNQNLRTIALSVHGRKEEKRI